MNEVLLCWKCGAELHDVPLPIGRSALCPSCGMDLHVCKMCLSFNPKVAKACEQPLEDIPHQKERANFCEWFEARPQAYQVKDKSSAEQARQQLEALFGLSASTKSQAQNPFADELPKPIKKTDNPFQD